MIKINTLYNLENVADCYYINDQLQIININTGKEKSQTLGARGYKYVTLNTKPDNKQLKVYVHKIIALAFIENNAYTAINHKDGNKLNNTIENLEFCTVQENTIHAWKHGLITRDEDIFKIIWSEHDYIIGTIKELVESTGIPKGTLYDNYYKQTSSRKWKFKQIIKVVNGESQETIEQGDTAKE